jgi:hypothetical protein
MDQAVTPCPCESPTARYDLFSGLRFGIDDTDGRYADVTISVCRTCGQPWVRYQVEYEAFTKSGRWARGKLTTEAAETLTPEEAADYIAALPSYFAGGSYFESPGFVKRGWMHWGI